MALEHQLMAIEVSGASVRLIRYQRGTDIYAELDERADDAFIAHTFVAPTKRTERPQPAGYEIIVSHVRFVDPEQALIFAEAVKSVALRAIYLRSLDEETV